MGEDIGHDVVVLQDMPSLAMDLHGGSRSVVRVWRKMHPVHEQEVHNVVFPIHSVVSNHDHSYSPINASPNNPPDDREIAAAQRHGATLQCDATAVESLSQGIRSNS